MPKVSEPWFQVHLEAAINFACSDAAVSAVDRPHLNDRERALINAQVLFPVGRKVRFYPWTQSSQHVDSSIRSAPWALGDGTLVVKIDGKAGGVSVDHLEVI